MSITSDNSKSLPTELDQAQELIRTLRQQLAQHKQKLEQTRNNERCFRELAEHIPEVFWMTNPLGDELVYISPAYEQIWGQTCQSLYEDPGKRLAWVHPGDRQRVLTAFKRDGSNGDYDETFRIDRPDGETRWIRDRAFPVHDEHGRIYRLAGFAIDITQAVDRQERMSRLGDTLASQERSSVFAALGTGLAHDIGQPLTAARNFIAQARRDPRAIDHAAGHPLLKRADQEIERAVAIIRHLRDFARDGRPTARRQPLGPILDEVRQLLDPQLRARQIGYSAPSDTELADLELSVDSVFAQQILRNLVANAIEASATRDNPDEPAHISLSVDHANNAHVDIVVSDNGPGIDDDATLFKPFATTKADGLGLGLSVSRSLAESHGGSLTMANRGSDGSGPTTFVLRLPR